jgi:hypothetical protein
MPNKNRGKKSRKMISDSTIVSLEDSGLYSGSNDEDEHQDTNADLDTIIVSMTFLFILYTI